MLTGREEKISAVDCWEKMATSTFQPQSDVKAPIPKIKEYKREIKSDYKVSFSYLNKQE